MKTKKDKTDKTKLKLIQEAVDAWKGGNLSSGAAMMVINHYLLPPIVATKEMIEHAKKLQPMARIVKTLKREKSLK